MSKMEPLTSIRQAEAKVSRRIADAQEEAKHIKAQAQIQAAAILDAARAKAECDGQVLKQDIMAQSRTEVQAILTEAEQQGDELTARGQACIAEAVARGMCCVLGEPEVQT